MRDAVAAGLPSELDEPVAWAKALRVHSWFYLLGIPLLAVLRHRGEAGLSRLAAIFGFAAVYFCWGYVFNNFFDIGEDSSERNSFKAMARPHALGITLLLQGALFAWALGEKLLPETLAVTALNALYSVPPVRLKRRLGPSLIANGIFFSFPYYAALKMLGAGSTVSDQRFTIFIFALFLPIQYIHFLEHRETDGKPNGLVPRAASLFFFAILCAVAAYAGGPALAWASAVYSLVGLGLLSYFESATRTRRAVRIASMIFGAYLALLAVVTP